MQQAAVGFLLSLFLLRFLEEGICHCSAEQLAPHWEGVCISAEVLCTIPDISRTLYESMIVDCYSEVRSHAIGHGRAHGGELGCPVRRDCSSAQVK